MQITISSPASRKKHVLLSLALLTSFAMTAVAPSWVHAQSVRAELGLSEAETRLEQALGGTRRQPIERLERQGLKLVLNEQAQGVMIEGWSTQPLTAAQAGSLFDQFGVRVVESPAGASGAFLAPDNVGRAGVIEGPVFMKMNGKVYRGLTLKGYGGNTVNGKPAQPGGSLDFAESIRDMEVSSVFLENNVDTYVGVLSVERPATAAGMRTEAGAKANYVRLSRTALRMEDFIRVRGPKLATLVDFMTDQLREEVGHKMSVSEFADWLSTKTGDLMARKDYLRFQHASITDSNLGLGEMVDLGDTWSGSGLRTPGSYRSQSADFQRIVQRVRQNLNGIDASVSVSGSDLKYDQAYSARLAELQAFDRARVNFSRASLAELEGLGFTNSEARSIIELNHSLPDGILDPVEIKALKTITRNVDEILARATSDFLRLSDGAQLSRYYLRNLGGAEGVRSVLNETRSFMEQRGYRLSRDASGRLVGNVAEVQAQLERIALAQAERAGFSRAVLANESTYFARFIATQALEVIVRR
jgi:hypothetical protein